MSGTTEVMVQSLRISLTTQNRLLLLKEKDGPLSLPLYIGQFEAESIVISLQDLEISRPQPHDLIRSAIKTLDGRILSAQITEMKAATLYAILDIQDADGQEKFIDCRPSDAIAIALRSNVPIYVNKELMQQYGIMPEQDVRTLRNSGNENHENEDDDLSAFSDFLANF